MKSYLEGCRVPTVKIGQIEIPRLIMGLHPFDWGTYVDRERDAECRRMFNRAGKVADVLRYAVQEEGITVTQVDHSEPIAHRLHLQAL